MQRLRPGSLVGTADAVTATSWRQKSKRKKKRRTVADLSYCAWRKGISLSDWGGLWLDVRSRYARSINFDADRADFLVPVVVHGQVGAATSADGKALLGRVLNSAGFPGVALTFHGLRAFLNTAASQLLIDKSTRETLGSWSRGSDMVVSYDRTTGAAELSLRAGIMDFFRSGGRLGKNFELPKQPPAAQPKRRRRRSPSSSSSDSSSSSSSSS